MPYAAPPAGLVSTLGHPVLHKLLFAVALLSQITIGMILGPIGQDLLKIQLLSSFKPEVYSEQLAKWTLEERARFEKHYILDYWFHPLMYGSLFASWVTLETSKLGYSPLPYPLLVLMPIVAGLCDFMENSIHYAHMRDASHIDLEESRIAGMFSLAKWTLVVPVGVWCLTRLLKRQFGGNKTKAQ